MNMANVEVGRKRRVSATVYFRWPVIVVLLLMCHVGAMVFAAVLATKHGGAAVIPNYYEKSLHWDEEKAARAAGGAGGAETPSVK
jgi:hypothetical protein